MNLNIMHKLFITNIFIYLNKRLDQKMMTRNNQILSFKTICYINECLFLFLLKWSLSHAIYSIHLIYLKFAML